MSKIRCSYPWQGTFNSLQDAVAYLHKRGDLARYLPEIVLYNIEQRDMLRAMGMHVYIEYLKVKCPRLASDKLAIDALLRLWEQIKHIANYDIQCYHIRDKFTVLGHTFHELKDLECHCSVKGKLSYGNFHVWRDKCQSLENIHIGKLFQSHMILNSDDWGDYQAYQNYIFRLQSITDDDMTAAKSVATNPHFSMISEKIPEHLLPILYYSGDGNYMLLATKKDKILPNIKL